MDSYAALKRNAFLNPIRNVVLVDDQFPSYQQLIKGSQIDKPTPAKALAIFNHYAVSGKICAVEEYECLASEPPLRDLSNLDLLILDYNLIPEDDTDSLKARKIIANLAASPAFNIIIVYTGEGDIHKVALEIASTLYFVKNETDFGLIIDEIESKDDTFEEDIDQFVTNDIKASFLSNRKIDKSSELFTRIQQALTGPDRRNTREVVEYLIRDRLSDLGRFQVNTSLSVSLEKHPVILGQNFLLVVIDKETPPDQFTSILNNCIDGIQLNPVQLVLQGMLTIANENAPKHIAHVVKNRELMAGLMLELAKDSDASKLAGRTLQELSAQIISEWSDKEGNQFKSELLSSPREFLLKHASIEIDKLDTKLNVFHELNRHLCTFSSIVTAHLTTGIILHDALDNQYWVVLNCSCDLAPDKSILKWKSKTSGFQPFTALQLTTRACIGTPLKNATDCRYVFIIDHGEKKALSYPPPNNNPHYETFYAENNGIFSDKKVQTKRFITSVTETLPTLTHSELRVVAQMRYEYATRFLNMLSAHKSRVGVDYVNLDHKPGNA